MDVSKIEVKLHEVFIYFDVIDPSLFMLLSQTPKGLQIEVSCDKKVFAMGNILRLGLSLFRQFVEAMNGRLYLNAAYVSGASFVMEMLGGRSKTVVSRPLSLMLSDTNKVDEKYVPYNLAVMLVDNSKAATKLLRRRIENCSDRAKSWDLKAVARTGEEAIQQCRNSGGAFDGVIMDQKFFLGMKLFVFYAKRQI